MILNYGRVLEYYFYKMLDNNNTTFEPEKSEVIVRYFYQVIVNLKIVHFHFIDYFTGIYVTD